MSGSQGVQPAHKLTVTLGQGEDRKVFREIVSSELTRDMEELAGGFELEVLDKARVAAARPSWWPVGPARGALRPGERAEIAIDGEVVLIGWVDLVGTDYGPNKLIHRITGRDVTGDLVDCAAAPDGPAEYSNLTLTELCQRICQPFGITVTADVDVGGPFPKFGIEPAETALSVIEKACRQRAVLAVSDGIGGLRLTRGGRTSAPEPLVFGGNLQVGGATLDHSQRFSTYIVKGQQRGSGTAAQNVSAVPIAEAAPERRPAPSSPAGARPRVVMTGRASDPAVTRYRPTVTMAKTQSGGASVQEQADWQMRTHRAKAESLRGTVKGWRAGEERRLWRPNERALVDDPLSNASAELLIASIVYRRNARDGDVVEMKLCGPEAFDLVAEGDRSQRRNQRRRHGSGPNQTAVPIAEAAPPRSTR